MREVQQSDFWLIPCQAVLLLGSRGRSAAVEKQEYIRISCDMEQVAYHRTIWLDWVDKVQGQQHPSQKQHCMRLNELPQPILRGGWHDPTTKYVFWQHLLHLQHWLRCTKQTIEGRETGEMLQKQL